MPKTQVLVEGLHLPESPRWKDGFLWFVDGPSIRRWSEEGGLETFVTTDCPVLLGLVFEPGGTVLTNDAVDRRVLRFAADGSLQVVAELGGFGTSMINELAVLRDGSILVGQIGYDVIGGADPAPSHLLRVTPDGQVAEHGPPIWFANGMVTREDGGEVLVAEFVKGAVWSFRMDADGLLDQGRPVAKELGMGVDGIAVAPDGTLWFANMLTGDIARVGPDGLASHAIPSGFGNATSLAFSPDGETAYVTAVRELPAPHNMGQALGAVIAVQF